MHNIMLKNLSDPNKLHLLHLFNNMLQTSYVPTDWKKSTIIPLRKPDKPADVPESYRPIALTFCLGKIMERIINRRLSWHLEKFNLLTASQSGFRKGRNTLDNIIGLELFIREGFNKRAPLNTYAIFLDISKAFDITWIQGILYKLSKKGIKGQILNWLNNLLRDRTYCVRIGDTHSDEYPAKIGVPQGSPLSPLLFYVMLDDFPILANPSQTFLFADDIELHTHAKDGQEAEKILTPYLDSISRWSRKWRITLSPAKSNVINFTRQKREQSEPLLFLSGIRIPEVNNIRHLGMHFDSGLRWSKHTEININKTTKLRNLFRILTSKRPKHRIANHSLQNAGTQ